GPLARDPGFQLLAGGEPASLPAGIDGVVLSPGVPADKPLLADARHRGVPVIAEVELAFPFLDGPVVGITGSNGKSTTTAMTGHLLKNAGIAAEVCGNIGLPLTEVADGAPGRTFVVELSSFQLEATDTFRPRAAALLNLSPDHLDRYPDLSAYAAAKQRIFQRQQGDDVAVLNADDAAVASLGVPSRRRVFSRHPEVVDGCALVGDMVIEAGSGRELFRAADVPLPGPHHLENAMAAALLALAAGVAAESLPAALRSFKGLPHRTEPVGEVGGVRFFDDSKGTNVGATAKALEGFADGSVHLILGGRGKGTGLGDELLDLIRRKARRVYLIGEEAERFGRELAGAPGDRVPLHRSERLEVAVPEAAAAARPGDTVLLSPACASFDQFRNYHHRGEVFQQLVAKVAAAAGQPLATRGEH
ncbi:MAG TPA: UDP-N-acetylmuramoyl-L-alanine--D-glutamate ligase, partial [Thermoanaerobaculia bacterium]|nr:UDP-N-acetylmuramoyl-L-alanine--D-glutamate ligase [Thermoanaerobaculia bacterium]